MNASTRSGLVLLCLSSATLARAADVLPASERPPGGLAVAQVPQFILLGFDDNPQTDPMTWIVDFLKDKRNADGTPVRAIFFSNGKYWNDRTLVAIHQRAFAEGHEIANHTQNHEHGDPLTIGQWHAEMAACDATFAQAGIPVADVAGFRTPFFEHTAATFEAIVGERKLYDSSLEEGFQSDQDGTNYFWPYTLDAGSPGNADSYPEDSPRRVGKYPGLWEIPNGAFLIPSDEACPNYDIKPGLRARVGAALKIAYGHGSGEPTDKIGGADWNVFESAHCTGPEFFAMLKLTLDRHLAGNRAAWMICGHTQLYTADHPDRRQAMEDFITYALTKPEVRFVTGRQLINWLRAPRPLMAAGSQN